MAKRGSVKELSVRHEDHIAKLFQGKRSKSSGAAAHDAGDVRTDGLLIECKMTGNPGTEVRALPRFVQDLEKIAQEAWEEAREPVLALRYYSPDSPLSAVDGWIDLTVTLAPALADYTSG